jgi:2-pyrone-4,6-dicarboxylate lactonase
MIAPCLPPHPSPRAVDFELPPGAWDTHVHAIGATERFPLAANRSYTPAQAPIEAYLALMDTLGIARAVLVQPSIYGTDNGAMVDALTRHPDRFRGVAVVDRSVDDATLDALHHAGVRGVRANLLNPGGISLADAEALAPRLAERGWHLQLQIDVSAFDAFDLLARLPLRVVIDHFGYMPMGKGPGEPGFRRLLERVADGACYVKLSAAYRLTAWQRDGFGAVGALAEALVDANVHRLLWGSDWPHTDVRIDMPDDGDLLNLLAAWLPDAALRRTVLVDNPQSLYDASAR